MASTSYDIKVNSSQAEQALSSLQNSIKNTNSSFEGLGKVLAGLALGSFVKNAYAMADALSDAAKAAGVSTASLYAFSKAVKASGGDTEGAINSMGKFSQAIEAAAGGSKEMQNRFLELGVTLDDLRTLSEEGILDKLLEGFANGTAGSQQLAASMAIFGKAFKGVNIKDVSEQMRAFRADAERAGSAIDSAGNASDAFKSATGNLGMAVLKALQPISELATKLLEAGSAMSKLIGIAVNIALLVASFTLIGKAISLVRIAFVGLAEGVGAVIGFFRTASNGVSNFGAILSNLKGVETLAGQFRVLLPLFKEFGSWLLKNIPGLALLASTIAMVGSAVWDFVKDLLVSVGLLESEVEASKKAADQKSKEAEQRRQVQFALQGEVDALNKLIGVYQSSIQTSALKYDADTRNLALGEEQKNLVNELASAETNYLTEVLKLRDQLLAKQQAAANGSAVDAAMIPKISEAIGVLTTNYETQIGTIKNLVTARNEATASANFELFATKRLADQENELMDIQHKMATSTMSEIQKKYADIEFAAKKAGRAAIQAEEARLKRRLDPQEARKYYDEALKGTDELKAAHAEEYEQSRKFSTGWDKAFREYADNATNAAKTAENLFKKATQGMEDAIVKFAKTGKFEWKDFLNMMLEELLRAQIQQMFSSILGGVSGAMSGGGGILGSIGSMLGLGGAGAAGGARGGSASTPVYVMDVSGGGSGGGGARSAAGGIAKKAGGGIMSGIGSLAKSATSGIGNMFSGMFGGAGSGQELLSGGGINPDFMGPLSEYASGFSLGDYQDQMVNSDMFDNGGNSDMFSDFGDSLSSGFDDFSSSMSDWGDSLGSFSDFEMPSFDMPSFDFGGWFANGGTLGAGKWGIAGENGPEMISGPATVTPMSSGTTNVTYNINATDAKSFQALLARDPQFLYAVTMQGAKSIPGAR